MTAEVSTAWSERRSGAVRHPDDVREVFEVDYARVVHSGAFRRLQGKTQILSLGDDDFYRTRLTHSLEVAQVAEGILQHLREDAAGVPRGIIPSSSLVRALGLAHDIGHPPFGHGGEAALNYCMRDAGGFEGNAQTLRLLACIEPYSEGYGADLARRTLLGLLKYPALHSAAVNDAIKPTLQPGLTVFASPDPVSCRPVKACFDADAEVLDWILQPLSTGDRERFTSVLPEMGKHASTVHKSLDCTVMDAADDIAYGVHDLEDAVALGLVTEGEFRASIGAGALEAVVSGIAARPVAGVHASYDGLVAGLFGDAGCRKRVIGRLVHHMIRATRILPEKGFDEPLLAWRLSLAPDARSLLDLMLDLVRDEVIFSASVQHLEFKGKRMVVATFEALMSSPRKLLPPSVAADFERADDKPRVICDYIASLTDAGLVRLHDRLFSPRSGTVFDRL
jgi:dGTPase